MNSHPTCPKCGKPLPASAPRQLCPECLLRAGFPTGRPALSASAGPEPRAPFTPPTPAELAPLFPQLEILECIGQGGMGAVYRARQPALDRLVALKILRPPTGNDPGFAGRFTREARALAKLAHPNIVAVHDYGQAGPHHYLLMEFIDGMNLRHLLNAGTISPKEALAIVPPICDALQFAHDQGIVHRDIKPENILLGKNGAVKIADFGLAKLVGAGGEDASLTGAGDVMGTPHYMAPEQVEKPREVDHRADIYSLGVVFYQMLTGELPLGRFGPPSRKVRIDVRLDEIVLRALEKEPDLRYQQASALRTEVEAVTQTSPPATKDATTNAWADGNLLVVPVNDAHLPLRCIKTNEPVTATEARRKEFVWFPPIIWLSLLMTPVAFIILYYLFRQSVALDVPLSATGRRQVRRHFLVATGLTAGGALALIAIIMNAYTGRWAGLGGGFFVLLILLGLVAMLAGLSHDSKRGMVLRAVKLQDGRLWLAGAGPAFLASLPRGDTAAPSRTPHRTPGPGAVILVTLCLLLALPAALYWRSRSGVERQSPPNVQPAPPLRPIAETAGYGPVVVRLVGDIARHEAPELLNLETGQLSFQKDILGDSLKGLTATLMADSFRAHGIDATGTLDPNTRGLAGWEICALPIGSKAFTDLGAMELRAALAESQPGSPVVMTGTGPLPATYAIKTRTGRFGLLQILGFSDKPHGVKVRYKLARPAADRPTMPPEARASVPTGFGQEQHNANTHQDLPPRIIFNSMPGLPQNPSRALPSDFDRMEGNPEILRILLQQAENAVIQIEARHRAGLVTNQDVNEARANVSLLQARVAGDRLKFARVQLATAEARLQIASTRYDTGLTDSAERESAKAEWEIAKVRLREAEKTVQQPSRVGDGPTH